MTKTARVLYWFFSFVVVVLALRWIPGGVAKSIPVMEYHLDSRAALLYLHMLGSLVPMAFIPFQINNRFRMKHQQLHRWMGMASIIGIYVGGLTLLPLAAYIPVPTWGRFGFMLAGSLWMAAGTVGLYFIRKRNIKLHRWWMMITAAIIFGAVTQRFALPIWITIGFDWKIAYSLSSFSGFTVNLTAFFLWQYRRKIGALFANKNQTDKLRKRAD
jgi:predicted membrane protein DUF2306